MRAAAVKGAHLFLVIAIAGCAIDLATKSWAFDALGMPREKPPRWLVDEVFGFESSLNEGALFGIGQGRSMAFALLSVVAAGGILYWMFWAGARRERLLSAALGCVMGGVLGNLYDRLGWHGLQWHALNGRGHAVGDRVYAVRDWLHFKLDPLNFDWPIFNIADSLLVCGAGLLIIHALFFAEPNEKADKAKTSAGKP